MPIALVTFVDSERIWFKSNLGLEGTGEIDRNEAFCAHAILDGAPDALVVHDALLDQRFSSNPLVTGETSLRFYAGVPIKIRHAGKVYKLGTVCVLDRVPHSSFPVKDKQVLLDVASIVADEVELFRGWALHVREEKERYITRTAHDLKTPLTVFKLATGLFKEHFTMLQTIEAEKSAVETTTAEDEAAQGFSSGPPQRTPADSNLSVAASYLDVTEQAEIACDIMEETVSNAIVSAKARWSGPEKCTKTDNGLSERVSVEELLKGLRQMGTKTFGDNVDIHIEVNEGLPLFVQTDGHRLRRVLVNLITNACKSAASGTAHDSEGQVLICASTIDCPRSNDGSCNAESSGVDCSGGSEMDSCSAPPSRETWLRFEVHDNGAGVPRNVASKLFREPFAAAALVARGSKSGGDDGIVCCEPQSAERFEDLEEMPSRPQNGGSEVHTVLHQENKSVPSDSTFTSRQGAGLGLFVVNLCVDEMGGTCNFRSSSGCFGSSLEVDGPLNQYAPPDIRLGGSVFWLDLPLNDSGQDDGAPSTRSGQSMDMARKGPSAGECHGGAPGTLHPSPSPKSMGRVLIVDDSVMILNGREGLAKMIEANYSVVVMDFLMPVLDGISATAAFRSWESTNRGDPKDEVAGHGGASPSSKRGFDAMSPATTYPHQLVVGISANAEETDLQAARCAGVDYFLTKPVNVSEIIRLVCAAGGDR